MTIEEMETEARDHRLGTDWQGDRDSIITSSANMVCSTLWKVCAEICQRLEWLNRNS